MTEGPSHQRLQAMTGASYTTGWDAIILHASSA
jgi:hypothetical protein